VSNVTVQLAPTANVDPQVFAVIAKSEALVPVNAIEEKVRIVFPVLVTVVWPDPLVVPIR
jgi:hypothetical protein